MKPEAEIDRLRMIVKEIVPALDLLQARLERGGYLKKLEGRWFLFAGKGGVIVSGKNLRELLISLIWVDC